MNIIESIDISSLVNKKFNSNTRVIFIRINPYPIDDTLKYIYNELFNKSWINKYGKSIIRKSIEERCNKTIKKISEKLSLCQDDSVSSEAGEYIISILGKQALTENLNYINIPLAELWKEKVLGNPGFDFHSESVENRIIFGEAKYVCGKNAYNNSLSQINEFIELKKDLIEIADLDNLVSELALSNFEDGKKGYAAAFSSTKIITSELIEHIFNNDSFKKLLIYDELLLVAADINE